MTRTTGAMRRSQRGRRYTRNLRARLRREEKRIKNLRDGLAQITKTKDGKTAKDNKAALEAVRKSAAALIDYDDRQAALLDADNPPPEEAVDAKS